MSASMHDIRDTVMTIRDCVRCQDWRKIQPKLWDLFKAATDYNQARRELLESLDPVQSTIQEIHGVAVEKHAKRVGEIQNDLRLMGAHFVKFDSVDIFCDAFVQSMIHEFGEEELGLAAY